VTLYALDGTSNRLNGGPKAWTHDKVFGGATGLGAKLRVRRAYQRICKHYANPTATAQDLTIDIVGFSRGAATALHLANVIYMMGIRGPLKWWQTIVPYRGAVGWVWFRDWPRLDDAELARIRQRIADVGLPENQLLVHDDIAVPRIRFLGLYDAVSSFVLPVDARIIDLQAYGFGFRLHVPPNIAQCSHAMALDERRKAFRNVRVHPTTMQRVRSLRNKEVGAWANSIAVLIAAWWLLYAVLPNESLGSLRIWTIVAFTGSLAVSFTHKFRASFRGDTDEGDTNTSGQISSLDLSVLSMAPGLGAMLGLFALAAIDWLGGFDNHALSALGPLFVADSTSLRTSAEQLGLAARRLAVLAVVAAWGFATWWLVAIATGRWLDAAGDLAPWLGLVAALAVAASAASVAGLRPSRSPTGSLADASWLSSAGAIAVFAMGVQIVLAAWAVRWIADRGLDLDAVPWWIYFAIPFTTGALAVAGGWRLHSLPTTPPPDLATISARFRDRPVREMWFRGNHTDIGGGGTPGLCDHALQWMTAEARRAGLDIDLPTVQSALDRRPGVAGPDHVGPTLDPFVSQARRPVLDGDLGHPSLEPTPHPIPEELQDRQRVCQSTHGAPSASLHQHVGSTTESRRHRPRVAASVIDADDHWRITTRDHRSS